MYISTASLIVLSFLLTEFQWSQREEIRFMVERDGSAKGIVFSQFTSFLDLINYSLHKVNLRSAFQCYFLFHFTEVQ